MIYKFASLNPKKQFKLKVRTTTRAKYERKLQRYTKYKKRKARRQQQGGFLSRYNFAYVRLDGVNQAMKGLDTLVPKLINQTWRKIGLHEIGLKQRWVIISINSKNYTTNHMWQRHLQNFIQAAWKSQKPKFPQLKQKLSRIIKTKQ